MFKRFVFAIALIAFVFVTECMGVSDPYISGDTVEFGTDPYYITFNSVTNWIRITNYSDTRNCQVDLICRDSNNDTGYTNLTNAFIIVPMSDADSNSPNTVEFKVSTRNMAFITNANASGSNEKIGFIVTGDHDFDF